MILLRHQHLKTLCVGVTHRRPELRPSNNRTYRRQAVACGINGLVNSVCHGEEHAVSGMASRRQTRKSWD